MSALHKILIHVNDRPATNSDARSQVTALLLAAGRSRRMGAFKPLLPFGDQTVIEACIENLRAAGVGNIIVVIGHRADEMRGRLAHLTDTAQTSSAQDSTGRIVTRIEIVENKMIGSEMGESIRLGVKRVALASRAVLIALADQPAVPPEAIRRIVEAWRVGNAPLVIPEYEGRGGHPSLVDLKLRARLQTLDERRGLRGLFEDYAAAVLRVPVETDRVVRDMDTWDEYLQLHVEMFGCAPEVDRPHTTATLER